MIYSLNSQSDQILNILSALTHTIMKPLKNNVIVEPIIGEQQVGSIILSHQETAKYAVQKGIVKYTSDNTFTEGETVMFVGTVGRDLVIDDKTLKVLNYNEIICRYELGRYQAVGDHIILRFLERDLNEVKQLKSGLYIHAMDKTDGKNAPEQATLYDSGKTVAVFYGLAYDEIYNDVPRKPMYFLETEENGDRICWCKKENVYAVIDGDKIIANKGHVFCEVPEEEPDTTPSGLVFIPETARAQDTTKKGYRATVVAFNKDDENITFDLNAGDTIVCEKNSDIPIKICGKDYIRVPSDRVCGKLNDLVKDSLKLVELLGAEKAIA